MSRFGASFAAGLLQGGVRGYLMGKDLERQGEKDALDKEERTLRMDALRRAGEREQAADAAAGEYADMMKTGQVDVRDQNGFAVTDQPMPEPGQAQQVTPTRREATQEDRLGALTRVAAARGDVAQMATLGQQATDARYTKEDLAYGQDLMANPGGEEAQRLYGMLGQNKTPGLSMRRDDKTGVTYLDLATPGGEPRAIELSGMNLARLGIAARKFQRGDVSALSDLADIDKGLASAAVADWKVKTDLAKFNNEAASKGATIADKQSTAADLTNQREAGARVAEKAGWNPEMVAAVRAGAMKPPGAEVDGNAPAEVKLANAYMAAVPGTSMKDALIWARSTKDASPQRLAADLYTKALAATYGDSKRAQKAVEEGMAYLSRFQSADGEAPPGAAAAGAVASGVAGQAARLPAGMVRQVGTSGGRPVYEDASGKRFVGD